MTKKLLYIVLGAIFVFGILFLLWTWLFSNGGIVSQNNGTFGTSTDSSNTIVGDSGADNGQSNLGQAGTGNNATNGTIPLGANSGSNSSGIGNANTGGGTSSTTFTVGGSGGAVLETGSNVSSGADWLNSFNGASINDISSGAGGFAPTITSQTTPSGSGGLTLAETLGITAIAGSLSCAIQAGIIVISTGGLAGSIPGGAVAALPASVTGVPVSDYGTHAALGASYALQAAQVARNAGKDNVTFLGCIVNTIAKTALQQITASVVNWINSGFKGSPSFVTNYQQFFSNTADLAAGQFIQGAGLAFLCSPFQLQIKIAIAQSYANRGAQSCSLTKVINNVNSFMKGNFAQGGWAGMLSFTTVPTNNPYGAFAYAQAGLANAQSTAAANAKNNISPTGFLNLTKQTCSGVSTINSGGTGVYVNSLQASQAAKSGAVCQPGCTCQTTTPGGAIATALDNTENSTLNQLGLANDLDQIINALTTQLLTRTLQNGLTSLSQTTTQTPADIAAQSQAVSLLTDMQSKVTLAQQLGSIDQGSISDIEAVQAGLSAVANCWGTLATSSGNSTPAQNAAAANTTLQTLGNQVTAFNNNITQINNSIATLNQFEAQISEAASVNDVANVTSSYNAAVAAGTFVSATDITTAQQNRTTLQGNLAALSASNTTNLKQCQAFGH